MTDEQKTGRLVRGVGGLYTVREADGQEVTLRARGRFRRDGQTPLVGDWVTYSPGEGDEHGWLQTILPRSSVLLRPPAANISLLMIVVAPEPEPDLLLVDRLLVHAKEAGYAALIVVNKCDLDLTLPEQLARQYALSGAPVMPVSSTRGDGLPALAEKMTGELCCVAGQSATGKSTLLGALCGLSLKTGELSSKIRRGKHTTRHAELLFAGGFTVLDTPGFSLLSLMTGLEPSCLLNYYPEFAGKSGCRFAPCLHDSEPGCVVREAVSRGEIDSARYERYRVLLKEARETWKARYN